MMHVVYNGCGVVFTACWMCSVLCDTCGVLYDGCGVYCMMHVVSDENGVVWCCVVCAACFMIDMLWCVMGAVRAVVCSINKRACINSRCCTRQTRTN